ncbi:MAG: complexin-2 [Lachnospiraceae bacterium]|nr:complexin-2 [Lachnospiraceae bacterium]
MKNVQISYDLFIALLQYHLVQDNSNEDAIKQMLGDKLDAMVRRELYGKYKTASTEAEREKARMEYLNKRGISEKFRW